MVEHRTENPGVSGSIPLLGINGLFSVKGHEDILPWPFYSMSDSIAAFALVAQFG